MAMLPEPQKKKRESFFAKVGDLLNWMASQIAHDAKKEANRLAGLKERKIASISSQKSAEELVFHAKQTLSSLEAFKEQLLRDFGREAQSFITKSLHPIIENAKRLIIEHKEGQDRLREGEEFSDFFVHVVQSVERYAQYKDEKKLRHKIISEAILETRNALEKDFQILRNYQHHALLEIQEDQETLIGILDRKLEPIFRELASLAQADIHHDDLHHFFGWKKEVDDKRGAFVELGFLTIDTILERKSVTPPVEAPDLESSLIMRSSEIVKLARLEERALKIFELLENDHVCNNKIIHEIEYMLFELKGEAESYQQDTLSIEEEKSTLEGTFQDLYESILKAEMLLEHRKRELFKKQK
jgi:hypothetical protein